MEKGCEKIKMEVVVRRKQDRPDELYHYGILGMKWGVRRYQNKDGSLTDEGRRRLGLDKYDKDHNTDTVVKKGTKVSRVISTPRYDEYTDPEIGGSIKAGKKYIDDILDKEKSYERKYVSVDGVKNSGRSNGKEYYLSWFTDAGWNPDFAQVTMYELKKDARVASGKQVVDALLEEVGSKKVTDMLKNNNSIKSLTLDYTRDQELFNRVNKRFVDQGYDAIEDINDLDTDMPVIMLNSSKTLGNPVYIQSGKAAIDEYLKKHGE